ncbi:hypothetical protein GJ744_002034 [Endocarpon pusillum]|uniref:NACHT domain-containing protein n=1 Tax=Endocarpon pusillum TaxID=364733 RepID=A0A8H7ACH2_9EURO|nr:hypothetical protein GJ744_002034 [Endocarpon pusillum]
MSKVMAHTSAQFYGANNQGVEVGLNSGTINYNINRIRDQECIQHLRVTDPRDDKDRIEDTKGGLLEEAYRWILENPDYQQWRYNEQNRLLWVKGDPGKGKTMLLCGIIDELNKSMAKTDLLSYFFCQATDSRLNSATAVLRGLIYLLIDQQPSLISYVQKKHDHGGKGLFEDTNSWVALSKIFTDILQDPSLSLNNTYLIIDALDECVADLQKLLDFIAKMSPGSSCVKWIVSSRNSSDIEEKLQRAGHKVRLSLELNAESVSTAVSIYIRHKVYQLACRKKYDNKTRDAILDHLSSNANDTFLWVALVCQNLENILRWDVLVRLKEFPPGLYPLYERMMVQLCNSNHTGLLKTILASIAAVYRPITLKELTSVVEMIEDIPGDLESLRQMVGLCGSFLIIREDIIYFVHQSAKDYLLEKASDMIFPFGIGDVHRIIFSRSLQVVSRTVKRDIYGLRELGYPIEQVKQPEPDPLAVSRYSCIYWIDHLLGWNADKYTTHKVDLKSERMIDEFLRNKYLYWLESLSLCRNMSHGVISMAKLECLLRGRANASALIELVRDARRFIMYHKQAIENTPQQTYTSALLFSPAGSLIRNINKKEEPKWITIKPDMEDKWSACLQTLEGHSSSVFSVAFSPDSARLASASDDRTVKIWDTGSGACLYTLEGYSSWVHLVAFSPDSARLASVSDNSTIKIWDIGSGTCLQTIRGHSSSVYSIAFSPDSAQLISALSGCIFKIWDTYNGVCLQTIKGNANSIAFSPDLAWLATISTDYTIEIWVINSNSCLQTLKGHSSVVYLIVFSPDSVQLASASDDNTVKIWDIGSGICLHTLKGYHGRDLYYGRSIYSVAFSPDSARLASASSNRTIKIWDIYNGICLQTLEGHSSSINSVAFSSDLAWLASVSSDRTIKIWDADNSTCLQTLKGHSDRVNSVAFSPDLAWLASASIDYTVKIWDAGSSICLQTLKGHSGWVNSVAFSPDSVRLASASNDHTVKIWYTDSNVCLQTLKGHSSWVNSVAFSSNLAQLASASNDRTVKIWDITSSICLQTFKGHSGWVNSVAFSPDSAWLVSASDDRTIKIWDTGNGICLQTLEGHSYSINSVAFSPDSAQLASASHDNTVKIWDADSGQCLQTLDIGKTLSNLSFDTTGSYLHTDIGTIIIKVSSASNILQRKTDPEIPQYQGAALSSDGTWITYNSEKLIWLPSEYRPSCSAISGKMIGIGTASGKVWIYHLSEPIISCVSDDRLARKSKQPEDHLVGKRTT